MKKQIYWSFVRQHSDLPKVQCNNLIKIAHHSELGSINIYYDDQAYNDLILERYLPEYSKNSSNIDIYYQSISREQQPQGYIYEAGAKITAVVLGWSFGYLKTVIHGIASYALSSKGFYPVHGCVYSINGRGILAIGNSGSGKTHLVMESFKSQKDIKKTLKICTDDWAFIKVNENGVKAVSVDNCITINNKTAIKYKSLFVDFDEVECRTRVRNRGISPSDLKYGIPTNEIFVTELYLLSDEMPCEKLIMNSLDFYPYRNAQEKKRHFVFWNNLLHKIPYKRLKISNFIITEILGRK